jgi:hypothetical protein
VPVTIFIYPGKRLGPPLNHPTDAKNYVPHPWSKYHVLQAWIEHFFTLFLREEALDLKLIMIN